MYEPFKRLALELLKAPTDPPAPPAGSHDSVAIFRASPRYLSYRMLRFWLHTAFNVLAELLFLVGAVTSRKPFVQGLAILAAVFIVIHQALQYFATRIDFDMRYYIVTDRSVRVRQGAWLVREMTITHANVQNLRVVQGPVQRLFGISNLEIDTAGGGGAHGGQTSAMVGGHTVRLAGIENAREVRDLILAHLRARGGGSGLGDLDDEPDGAVTAVPASAVPSTEGSTLVEALRDLRDATRVLRTSVESRG